MLIEFPDPLAAVHDDPAVAEQVQVIPVSAAGTVSTTETDPAFEGPALVTATV